MNTIKELRQEKGWTQDDLAAKLNQTKSNISKYERGTLDPSSQVLLRLSDVFDVSVDYLLGNSKDKRKVSKTDLSETKIPPEFVMLARKTGDLSEDKKQKIYHLLDNTIDKVLEMLDKEE